MRISIENLDLKLFDCPDHLSPVIGSYACQCRDLILSVIAEVFEDFLLPNDTLEIDSVNIDLGYINYDFITREKLYKIMVEALTRQGWQLSQNKAQNKNVLNNTTDSFKNTTSSYDNVYHLKTARSRASKIAIITAKHLGNSFIKSASQCVKINLHKRTFNSVKKNSNYFSFNLNSDFLPGNLYPLDNIVINSFSNQIKLNSILYSSIPFFDSCLGVNFLPQEIENLVSFQDKYIAIPNYNIGNIVNNLENKTDIKISGNGTYSDRSLVQHRSLDYDSKESSTQIYVEHKRKINGDLISFSKENFSLAEQSVAKHSYSAVQDCNGDISPYQDDKQGLIRSLLDNIIQTSILFKDDISDNVTREVDNTKKAYIFKDKIQQGSIQYLGIGFTLEKEENGEKESHAHNGRFYHLKNSLAQDHILTPNETTHPNSIFSSITSVKPVNFNNQKHILTFDNAAHIDDIKMLKERLFLQELFGQCMFAQYDKIRSDELAGLHLGTKRFEASVDYSQIEYSPINTNNFDYDETKSNTSADIVSLVNYRDYNNLYDIEGQNKYVSLSCKNDMTITEKELIAEKYFQHKTLPKINIQNLEIDGHYNDNPYLLRALIFNENRKKSILTSLFLLVLESDELESDHIKSQFVKKLNVDYLNLLVENYEWRDLIRIPINIHTIITNFLIENKIAITDSCNEIKSIVDIALIELDNQKESLPEEAYLATVESGLSFENLAETHDTNTLAKLAPRLMIKDKYYSNQKQSFDVDSSTTEHLVTASISDAQNEGIESRVCTPNVAQSGSVTQILNELLFLRQNCSVGHSKPIDVLLADTICSALEETSSTHTNSDSNIGEDSFDEKANKIGQNNNTSSLTLSNLLSTSVLTNGLDKLKWIRPIKLLNQEALYSIESSIRWADNNFERLFYYIFNDKSIPKNVFDSFSNLAKRNSKQNFLAFKSLMCCLNTLETMPVPLFRLYLEAFVCFGLELLLMVVGRQYRSKGIDKIITKHVVRKYTEIDQFNKGYIVKQSSKKLNFQDRNRKTASTSSQARKVAGSLRGTDDIGSDTLSLEAVDELSSFISASFLNEYDACVFCVEGILTQHPSNDEVYRYPKESISDSLNSLSHTQVLDSQYNVNQLKNDRNLECSINISGRHISVNPLHLIQSDIIKNIAVNKINPTHENANILYRLTNQAFYESSYNTSLIEGEVCHSLIASEIEHTNICTDIANNILIDSRPDEVDLSRFFCHRIDDSDVLSELIVLNTSEYLQFNTMINERLADTKHEYLLDYGAIKNDLVKQTKSNCHLLNSQYLSCSQDDIILDNFIDKLNRFNSPQPREQYRINRPDDAYRVEDAGIVLLGPFLRTLWDRCQFNDLLQEDARHKMLELLHWAVWQTEIEADDGDGLDCARIATSLALCGYAEDDFIIDSLNKPSEAHCRELQVLLDSLQLHWSVLQRFARSKGLHSMFFQRSGALKKKKDSWELKVDKAGHDILLNSCPWSFNMIRLPWNDATILVDWPIGK